MSHRQTNNEIRGEAIVDKYFKMKQLKTHILYINIIIIVMVQTILILCELNFLSTHTNKEPG